MTNDSLIRKLNDALNGMVNATMYKDHPAESEAALEALEDADDYFTAMGEVTGTGAPDGSIPSSSTNPCEISVVTLRDVVAKAFEDFEGKPNPETDDMDIYDVILHYLRPYLRQPEPVSVKPDNSIAARIEWSKEHSKTEQPVEATHHGELVIGAFYWVRIVFDPDTDNEWENEDMPARYAGGGKWIYPGEDGVSDWPVRWVGPRIEMATRERESGWRPIETAPKDGQEFIVLIQHSLKTKSWLKAGEEQAYKDCPLTYTARWNVRTDYEELVIYRNPGAPHGFLVLGRDDVDGWIPMPTNEIEGQS